MVEVITAWLQAHVQSETKLEVDAIAKAHGEPISMPTADCTSFMVQFNKQYGDDILDERLPVRSSSCTIRTKMRYTSAMPSPLEELRTEFARSTQGCLICVCPLHSDLDTRLGKKNFLLESEIAGAIMVVPK